MRTLPKVILTILLFFVLYGIIMLGVYHFFYPYPVGYLDVVERADNRLNYKLITQQKLDKETTLYFSRSNNGAGDKLHVGTIDSKWPAFFANYFCDHTSSIYFPINSYGYVTASDDQATCFLFGATSDQNTVKVQIVFKLNSDEKQVFEADVKDFIFSIPNFDYYYGQFPSYIMGLNEDDGITFEYGGGPLDDGGYISRDPEKRS